MANDQRVRANNAYGLVGAQINAGDTTMTFVTAPIFPAIDATKYLPIILEPDTPNEEIVYVTAFTAGALTATILRAREGTAAIIHPIGSPWVHGPTAADFPDSILLPPAGTTYDDEFNAATLDPKWSWVNQSNATLAVARSRLAITKPSNGLGINNVFVVESGPAATPYEITAGPIITLGESQTYAGLCVRGSVSGRWVAAIVGQNSSNVSALDVISGTTTTFNADIRNVALAGLGAAPGIFLRIKDDGTTFTFSYSMDGVAWRQFTTTTRASWLTDPNQIGFIADAYGGDLVMSTDFIRRTL